jgi:hypothetical protein
MLSGVVDVANKLCCWRFFAVHTLVSSVIRGMCGARVLCTCSFVSARWQVYRHLRKWLQRFSIATTVVTPPGTRVMICFQQSVFFVFEVYVMNEISHQYSSALFCLAAILGTARDPRELGLRAGWPRVPPALWGPKEWDVDGLTGPARSSQTCQVGWETNTPLAVCSSRDNLQLGHVKVDVGRKCRTPTVLRRQPGLSKNLFQY